MAHPKLPSIIRVGYAQRGGMNSMYYNKIASYKQKSQAVTKGWKFIRKKNFHIAMVYF